MSAATESIRVDIWSDVVCPWCAIGKANPDAALGEFAHPDKVDIIWHRASLDTTAPAASHANYVVLLA